jgi:hypothetical protein
MLPNLLLGLGLALALTGGFLKFRSGSVLDQFAASAADRVEVTAPETMTNEEKAQAFEEWVIAHLSKQHHTLKDMRSDRNARYAADVHPDMVVALDLGGQEYPFAIECKWRNSLMGAGVDMSQEQIARYQRFALDRQMPIFLIMGIGGHPSAPAELFVVPLNRLEGRFGMAEMESYKQAMKNPGFYYDSFKQNLSY